MGNDLLLYVQGGNMQQGPSGPGQQNCTGQGGDQIHLFRATHSLAGVTGLFAYQRRITPCEKIEGTTTNYSWGPGQVFFDGSYRIVADKSDTFDFKRLSLGTSSDGLRWTWQDFLESTAEGLEVYAPVLRYTGSNYFCNPACHSHSYWEGSFPMNTPGWGTGRMKVDASEAYPRGFRISILDSGNAWRTLDDATGELDFIPKNVWSNVGVRSLVLNDGVWELWAYQNVPHNGCHECGSGPYTPGPAGTTFTYRTVSSSWSLGTPQPVTSIPRCMPSDSHVGRLYPFRYNGIPGAKLLFSATNDGNMCRDGVANPFQGMYIVVTEIDD